jgi:hypothetical protein
LELRIQGLGFRVNNSNSYTYTCLYFERDLETSKLRPLEEGRGEEGGEQTPLAWEVFDAREASRGQVGGGRGGGGGCIIPRGQCGGFFFEPFLQGPGVRGCCPSPGDEVGMDETNVNEHRGHRERCLT